MTDSPIPHWDQCIRNVLRLQLVEPNIPDSGEQVVFQCSDVPAHVEVRFRFAQPQKLLQRTGGELCESGDLSFALLFLYLKVPCFLGVNAARNQRPEGGGLFFGDRYRNGGRPPKTYIPSAAIHLEAKDERACAALIPDKEKEIWFDGVSPIFDCQQISAGDFWFHRSVPHIVSHNCNRIQRKPKGAQRGWQTEERLGARLKP